jgi:hypothetical protein
MRRRTLLVVLAGMAVVVAAGYDHSGRLRPRVKRPARGQLAKR